jgi:uncharacterized membrane protein YkoI
MRTPRTIERPAIRTHAVAWSLLGLVTMAASAAAVPADASLPEGALMLTIPQAVTIAEVTQGGTAYGLKREREGRDVVYHVKLSTPDRGVVEVHVGAYGGRVDVLQRDDR